MLVYWAKSDQYSLIEQSLYIKIHCTGLKSLCSNRTLKYTKNTEAYIAYILNTLTEYSISKFLCNTVHIRA